MRKKNDDERVKSRSIGLTDEEMDILCEVAKQLNSSLSYALRLIIREYWKAVEKE